MRRHLPLAGVKRALRSASEWDWALARLDDDAISAKFQLIEKTFMQDSCHANECSPSGVSNSIVRMPASSRALLASASTSITWKSQHFGGLLPTWQQRSLTSAFSTTAGDPASSRRRARTTSADFEKQSSLQLCLDKWNKRGFRVIDYENSDVSPRRIRAAWRELRAMDGDDEKLKSMGMDDTHVYNQIVKYLFHRSAWQAARISDTTSRFDNRSNTSNRKSCNQVSAMSKRLMRLTKSKLASLTWPSESRKCFYSAVSMFAELERLEHEEHLYNKTSSPSLLTPAVYRDMIGACLTASYFSKKSRQQSNLWTRAYQLARHRAESMVEFQSNDLLQNMIELCPKTKLPVGPIRVLSLAQSPNTYMFNSVLKVLNNDGYYAHVSLLWEALVSLQGNHEYLDALTKADAEVNNRAAAGVSAKSGHTNFEGQDFIDLDVLKWPKNKDEKGTTPQLNERSQAQDMLGANRSGSKSIQADKYTVSMIASAYTRSDRPHLAYATINSYLEANGSSRIEGGTDIALLNAALYACAKMGEMEPMQDLIARIAAQGSTPDSYTMHALLLVLCRNEREREAYHLLKEWQRLIADQESVDQDALERDNRLARMKGRPGEHKTHRHRKASGEIINGKNQGKIHSKSRPSAMSFNIILQACALKHDLDFANDVISEMDRLGIVPDESTFRVVLYMFGDSTIWKGLFKGHFAERFELMQKRIEQDTKSPHWHQGLEEARKAWESASMTGKEHSHLKVVHKKAFTEKKLKITTFKASGTEHSEGADKRSPETKRMPIKEAKRAVEMNGIHDDANEDTGYGKILDVRGLSEMQVKLLLNESLSDLIENSPSTIAIRNTDILVITGYGRPFQHAWRLFSSMELEPSTVDGNAGRLFLAGEEIEAYAIRKANAANMEELQRSLKFRGSLLAVMVLGPLFVVPSTIKLFNGVFV